DRESDDQVGDVARRHPAEVDVGEDRYEHGHHDREGDGDQHQHPVHEDRAQLDPLGAQHVHHDGAPDRYSWAAAVAERNASSRDSVWVESSCSPAPAADAASPIDSSVTPCTSAATGAEASPTSLIVASVRPSAS